jgi:hypothetical protein
VKLVLLLFVEDEEEAARLAMKLEKGAVDGAAHELEALALRDGLDVDDVMDAIKKQFAFLGPQVSVLPEAVAVPAEDGP